MNYYVIEYRFSKRRLIVSGNQLYGLRSKVAILYEPKSNFSYTECIDWLSDYELKIQDWIINLLLGWLF